MKTSHVIIAVSLVAVAGGGAYLYWNSTTRKRKWIINQMKLMNETNGISKVEKMSDDEIKLVYKLLSITFKPGMSAEKAKLLMTEDEMDDLVVISDKYNIF